MKTLRACAVITSLLLLLCSGAYPFAVTAAAQGIFPEQSRGSLITQGGRVRGSSLLGQGSARADLFWSRPSAASVDAATGVTVSGGSNLSPTNGTLHEAVRTRVAALRASGVTGEIPVDLVTASASGLDPHISPEAAAVQVPRVARARGMSEESLRARVRAHTEGRTLGLLGEPRVNVLRLNLDLESR
jgi:K+-transporting ATPase ATPase C chain